MKFTTRQSLTYFGFWCVLLAAILLLALSANRGFDLIDGSYYLAWIIDPSRYEASIHPFGLPLHLLYSATGTSIVVMRLTGLVLIISTGSILGFYIERFIKIFADRPPNGINFALLGAIFSLSYYVFWLLTPSYNMLANVGASLIISGVLGWFIADRGVLNLQEYGASVLVGMGGFVSFFAKPTFAALAGLVVAILLFYSWWLHGAKRASTRIIVTLVACMLPLVYVLHSTVGITGFVDSIRIGLKVLNFGNSISSLPLKTVRELMHAPALLAITGTALFFSVLTEASLHQDSKASARVKRLAYFLLVLSLAYLGRAVLLDGVLAKNWDLWVLVGIPVTCVVMCQVCCGILRDTSNRMLPPLRRLVLGLILVPFAISFGTANNILNQTGLSLFAPLLASAVAARVQFSTRIAVAIQAGAATFVLTILFCSANVPYGLPASIWKHSIPIRMPFNNEELYVDAASHKYLQELIEVTRNKQFAAETHVIDLSGLGPGTVLFMNMRAPFFPLLTPGFPSSTPIADAAWASLSEEQRMAAWIIGPVHPDFATAKAAIRLREYQSQYKQSAQLTVGFKDKSFSIEIWQPEVAKHHNTIILK